MNEEPGWFDLAASADPAVTAPRPGGWPSPGTIAPAHRRGFAAIIVLSVLLTGCVGLGAYLWVSADRWRADSSAWQTQARAQAQQVRDLESKLEASAQELASARDQLTAATARITTLADEKAQLGDMTATTQQYLDYQKRISSAAGVVADALGRCTAGQSQLIIYLRDPSQYDPADLTEFANQVDGMCQQATDANAQLQQELQQELQQ